MAREQGPVRDTGMRIHECDVGDKRINKGESLEIEEGRRHNKARERAHIGNIVLTNETMMTTSQDHRDP